MNFYAHFNLAMDRSPGFGSAFANFFALFRLAFASAPVLKTLTSLHNVTRRSVLQKVQGRASNALPLLVNIGFQVLFHSPPGVLFTFPSRYSFAIGHQVVFSLGGWSPLLPAGFLVSCGTLVPARRFGFSSTGLLPPLAGLSFPIRLNLRDASRRPATPPCRSKMVWALPRSLAATWRIVLSFFSSGYLDVSVPRVPSPETMCSSQRDGPSVRRVPPFGYLRFSARLRLPVAFRSLPRPSSALGA